ncbi:hypothetical protein C0992_000114, partial [Termitomyces sp. T32_za158]
MTSLRNSEHVATADVKLYLPLAMLGKAYCDPKFQDIEWSLRYAQAHETLYEVRSAILTCSQMYKTKDALVHGQQMHTCSNAFIQTVLECITQGMIKYNEIHVVMVGLGRALCKVGLDDVLKELTSAEVGGITAFEDTRSEGSQSVSWIWKLSDGNSMERKGSRK